MQSANLIGWVWLGRTLCECHKHNFKELSGIREEAVHNSLIKTSVPRSKAEDDIRRETYKIKKIDTCKGFR